MNHRILVLLAAASCGRIGFDATTGDSSLATTNDGTTVDACTFSGWSTPVQVPVLSSGAADGGSQVSADGLTIYLGINGNLNVARRPTRTAPWSTPAPLGFATGMDDDASVTPDELELFFTRYAVSECMFSAKRASTSASWPTPTQMNGFCSGVSDGGPYVTPDGLTLLYTEMPIGNGEGTLMVTTRASRAAQFTPGVPVAGISMPDIGYPALSGDQLTIYFESGNPLDLYQATRPDLGSPFGAVTPVANVNMPSALDEDPSITADGRELYFDSDRGGAQTDIYVSTRTCL